MKNELRSALNRLGWDIHRLPPSNESLQRAWRKGGKVPWSMGYRKAKAQFIAEVVSDPSILRIFRKHLRLPDNYGVRYDERCIELPWVLERLKKVGKRVLDAGSALNQDYILRFPSVSSKIIHILTLSPEKNCFWQRGVSYLYEDLRSIPIKDDYYDAIVCVSTLEHVGFDNSTVTGDHRFRENSTDDMLVAVREMRRVLKPRGKLFISVPFGRYQHLGWSQQFDKKLIARMVRAFGKRSKVVETYYRYSKAGWQLALAEECEQCTYVEWISSAWMSNKWPDPIPVEPDGAAAARAVACVELSAEE